MDCKATHGPASCSSHADMGVAGNVSDGRRHDRVLRPWRFACDRTLIAIWTVLIALAEADKLPFVLTFLRRPVLIGGACKSVEPCLRHTWMWERRSMIMQGHTWPRLC